MQGNIKDLSISKLLYSVNVYNRLFVGGRDRNTRPDYVNDVTSKGLLLLNVMQYCCSPEVVGVA